MNPTAFVIEGTNEEYHSRTEYSRSQLVDAIEDPLKFYRRHVVKTAPKKKPTKDMDFGNLCHQFIFEPENVVRIPEDVLSKSGSRAGAAYHDFVSQHPYKTLLKPEEFDELLALETAIKNHPAANAMTYGDSRKEFGVAWQDRETGIHLRIRLDLVLPTMISDGKTCRSADADDFARDVYAMHYDFQAAMYQDGYYQLTGYKLPFVFQAWEKPTEDWPFWRIATYEMPRAFMVIGYEKYRSVLATIKRCHSTGQWQTEEYGRILELPIPGYAKFNKWRTES